MGVVAAGELDGIGSGAGEVGEAGQGLENGAAGEELGGDAAAILAQDFVDLFLGFVALAAGEAEGDRSAGGGGVEELVGGELAGEIIDEVAAGEGDGGHVRIVAGPDVGEVIERADDAAHAFGNVESLGQQRLPAGAGGQAADLGIELVEPGEQGGLGGLEISAGDLDAIPRGLHLGALGLEGAAEGCEAGQGHAAGKEDGSGCAELGISPGPVGDEFV